MVSYKALNTDDKSTKTTTVQVIDGLKYIIYTDQNCATLINNNYTQSEIVIPAEITWEGKKYPVTELGNSCFKDCQSLKSITIPSSVTRLGSSCFWNCASLTSITIPSSVTSIGDWCFWGCYNLTSITIPSSVTSLGENCFDGCYKLTSITIPSSVTSLGEKCFNCCTKLTSITIPSTVTTLPDWCFSGCVSLKSITIPSSVTSLGRWCFSYCQSLTSITIPSSVTSIGDYCFVNCSGLTSMYIKSTTPPYVSSSTFADFRQSACTLYVPIGATEAYENAPYWQAFSIIKEMDFTTAVNGVYTPGKLVTVYALDGTVVKRQADRARLSETLPRGIYIVEGKKYVVR